MTQQARSSESLPDVILIRRADAEPQAWKALGDMASAIGAEVVVDFEIPETVPEQDTTPRYAGLADFHVIAKAHGKSSFNTTRAWEKLTVGFIMAHNADTEPHVRFATHPPERGTWPEDCLITDLDISSLAALAKKLRAAIETRTKAAANKVINAHLGKQSSVGVVAFYELVVASWPPRSEESTQ